MLVFDGLMVHLAPSKLWNHQSGICLLLWCIPN